MRWFFLVLLVANIVYVTWELNRERPQRSATVALPPHVERIVLLSELESEPTRDDAVAVGADRTTALAPESKPEQVTASLQQQRLAEKTEAQPEAAAAAVASKADTVDLAVVDQQKQTAMPVDKPDDLPVSQPAADLCYTLGPFREMKTLRVVTREIKDYVIEASFRSRQEQEQSMFRVYLKPVGGKKEARALIKQLVSKNIRDYFIITDGPNKNGISLGFFSEKRRAERHARRVRELGFDAIIEPVFRSYTIYWLDYRIEAGNEIPGQIFDQHLDNTIQRLSRSCV